MDVTKAILHINPNARFICWENDYKRITYNDAQHVGVKPTYEECLAAWEAIKDEPPIKTPDEVIAELRAEITTMKARLEKAKI